MTLKINSLAPDFKAKTTIGDISFHEWLGDSWGVLFSHPKDFTPVCTTELGYMANIQEEFKKREINLHWQNYECKEYNQLFGDFIPYLSVVDLLFNHGEKAGEVI